MRKALLGFKTIVRTVKIISNEHKTDKEGD